MSRFSMTKDIIKEYGVTLQKLSILEIETRILKRIRTIQNECATNLIYYEKNKDVLKDRYDLNKVPENIQDIMFTTMEIRKEIATNLLIKLDQFNKEYDIPITKIEGIKIEVIDNANKSMSRV